MGSHVQGRARGRGPELGSIEGRRWGAVQLYVVLKVVDNLVASISG